MEILKCEGVRKVYGSGGNQVTALDGIDLSVGKGEFAAIVGASGSGKSTLMSVLSGLERSDGGRVFYGSEEITAMNDKRLTEFRRREVGFIFQQYYLLPHLSVDKNVKMGADLAGNGNYREIIEKVGLSDKLKNKPSELSGGEQQRVSIARALAKRPKVLFLDEPTGALDEQTGRQVLDYICKLQKEYDFTILLVTHNLNIAEMANTVIKMNSGKISEIDTNETKKTAYEIGW